MMWEIGVALVVAIIVVRISHWFYTWANPKCNGKLPPGSMGLPFIGESIQFLSPHALYDIPPFIRKRMARYGSLFRTSLVGLKIVVSTDPEINYRIFLQEKNFVLYYPDSFKDLLGEQNFIFHGSVHKYFKKLILTLVGPEILRKNVLQEVNESTCRHLHSWANHGSFEVRDGASQMIFEYFSKKLISYDEAKEGKKLRQNYKAFTEGVFSYPLNIPGTAFHACLQGRKKAMKVIKDIYDERKASKICRHDDFLDLLLEEVEKEDTIMNEAVATNLVFGLLFAVNESTSSALTLLTKYIFDHPHVLAELTKEHEAILRSREKEQSEITWEEYKTMTFTHMVINETVRLANIAPAIFRKVMNDVEINGYTIPEGWLVMVVPSVVHLNPDKYEDPLAFNPWRWEGIELHVGSRTFMAFGGGIRLCSGAEYSKLQMTIFLHHLVTKYRWSVIKGGDVVRKPGLVFPNGLHIQIAEKHK